ncbi:MAG: hypothetical protein QNL04_04445 [SAR324 cluster bacterium]|nr:hypothetical protein [SAR324 cluster bacterium]
MAKPVKNWPLWLRRCQQQGVFGSTGNFKAFCKEKGVSYETARRQKAKLGFPLKELQEEIVEEAKPVEEAKEPVSSPSPSLAPKPQEKEVKEPKEAPKPAPKSKAGRPRQIPWAKLFKKFLKTDLSLSDFASKAGLDVDSEEFKQETLLWEEGRASAQPTAKVNFDFEDFDNKMLDSIAANRLLSDQLTESIQSDIPHLETIQEKKDAMNSLKLATELQTKALELVSYYRQDNRNYTERNYIKMVETAISLIMDNENHPEFKLREACYFLTGSGVPETYWKQLAEDAKLERTDEIKAAIENLNQEKPLIHTTNEITNE